MHASIATILVASSAGVLASGSELLQPKAISHIETIGSLVDVPVRRTVPPLPILTKKHCKKLLLGPADNWDDDAELQNRRRMQSNAADFCWNTSYGRGVGTVVDQCPSDRNRIGALCYSWCPQGYHRYGFDCHSDCREGYTSEMLWYCERWHWHFIFPVLEWSHNKQIIIGDPVTLTCGGRENDAGLCYEWCREGYNGVGPVCWSKPRPGWVACGMGQAKDDVACGFATTSQVTSVAQVTVFVASLGTSSTTQPALIGPKVAKLIAKLRRLYDIWEPVITKLTYFVYGTAWFLEFANLLAHMHEEGGITATDVSRVTAELTAIVDPTGVTAILAAYTYDTCDQPQRAQHPTPILPPVVRAYRPQISGAFACSATVQFLDTGKRWQRIFDFGNGAAKENVLFGQRANSNDLYLEVFEPNSTTRHSLIAPNAIAVNEKALFGAGIDPDGTMWIRKNGVDIAQTTGVVPANVARSNRFVGKSNFAGDDPLKGEISNFALLNHVRGAFEASATVEFSAMPSVSAWMRVFDIGGGPAQDNLILTQFSNTKSMQFSIYRAGLNMAIETANGLIVPNQSADWSCGVTTTGWMWIKKDGVMVAQGQGHVPRDIVRKNVFLGKSNWHADTDFDGAIANFVIKNT